MTGNDVELQHLESDFNLSKEFENNENLTSNVEITPPKPPNFLDKYFEISKRGSRISTEFFGGLTTFLSMAFILSTNPNLLSLPFSTLHDSEVVPHFWNSVFIATCFASSFSTFLMAFVPNMPFALAPGMGLNAQVIAYMYGDVGVSYTFAGSMTIVFVAGVLFMIISLTGLREFFFDGIPESVKSAIPIGIGLFVAFVGLQNGIYTYIYTYTYIYIYYFL
jgi:AGZA family xanthine/uracil permease-like MFS transporter